ncbi:MAG: hypothetical protein ACFFD4_37740 [Candidatus Odinarchaeota archaeon]
MHNKIIMKYMLVFLGIIAVHFIIYTITPGNWPGALITSIIILWVFLPVNGSSNSDSHDKSLTFSELAKSVNLDEMDSEEQEFHSALGTVFNTMAQNATQDIYSSEMTSSDNQTKKSAEKTSIITSEIFEKIATDKTSYQSSGIMNALEDTKTFDDLNFFPVEDSDPFDIKLEVDPDGKLHYIFQETEITPIEGSHGNESVPVEVQEDIMEKMAENSGIGIEKWLENTKNLYLSNFQQEKFENNQDLLQILINHLDRINVIISFINDEEELMVAKKILEPFSKLLLDWLLEERGLLYSSRPSSPMSKIGRKVALPARDELHINQLSNYFGKIAIIVRFLAASGAFNWLTELFELVSEIRRINPDPGTECLQAINLEVVSFLGECASSLLSSNPASTGEQNNSKKSGEKEF